MKFKIGDIVYNETFGLGKVFCIDSDRDILVSFIKPHSDLHTGNRKLSSNTGWWFYADSTIKKYLIKINLIY